MSTSSTVTFSGSSTYSSSFQQVITRAVAIASLPQQSLQNDVTNSTSKATALSGLGVTFNNLQSDIRALSTAATGSQTATSSNASAVSATASSTALSGAYTVQVDDVGSSTTAVSSAGTTAVTYPSSTSISSASSYTLTVNGSATTITPATDSLESLASAINSSSAGVQATIVNIGSTASPDYRLAVTSNNLGPDTIQLNDGASDLLDTLSTGANAQYKVNGSATDIQSTSSQVTLSPGLTVNLLAQTSSPVTITVAQSSSSLETALSTFVTDYNSAVTSLQQNVGQNGGALNGDSLIYTLSNLLGQVAQYESGSSSGISNLASLGITLQENGQLSFDQATYAGASAGDIQRFLGSSASSGFLQSASGVLSSITDSTSGLIATDYTAVQSQIANDNTQISADQDTVTALQKNLQTQLSQADAVIANLQSQVTYFTQLFAAEFGTSSSSSKS